MNALAVQVRLWYWQRTSAMVLAVCTLVHLVVIIYAVRGGLSAGQILGRTHGSIAFGLFYTIFVVACAVHVPVGLAHIIQETLRWRAKPAWCASGLFAVLLLYAGLRAVYAVVLR